MHTSPLPALFGPGQTVSPYLATWRQAFAALDPAHSRPVALWFDRGAHPPVVETVRIPRDPDAQTRRLTILYLSALINNVLCTRGARRVSVVSDTAAAAQNLAFALEKQFFLRLDSFSNMSLRFLHALIRQVFEADFAMDADQERADALRERLPSTTSQPDGPDETTGPGTVLAINIGQRLTSLALVDIDTRLGHGVTHLVRRDTWPTGSPQCLCSVWGEILAEARQIVAASGRGIDAVGLSVAATTLSGTIHPVPEFGLFAACSPEELDAAGTILRQTCQAAFPGRPLAIVNDGEAQALFAFHYDLPQETAANGAPGGDMLSLRLGACPAIHCLDASGRAVAGLNEYGWLVTRYAPDRTTGSLFSTIRLYLSHYGVAVVAHELGLLEKYQLHHEAAIPFFHDALVGNEAPTRNDATQVYVILGAHLAMLAHELHRNRPLASIRLQGSRANKIDAPVFAAMVDGFAGFADRHDLPLDGIRLDLLDDASSIAGLVGAAHAALRRRRASGAA